MKKTVLLGFACLSFGSSTLQAEEPRPVEVLHPAQSSRRLALVTGCLEPGQETSIGTTENESRSKSNVQFCEFLSGWLKTQPKFDTFFAVHFTSEDSSPVISCAALEETEDIQKKVSDNLRIPRINKPMTFSTALPSGIGKIVDEVISCGHRICNGKQCVDVSDEQVKGNDCANDTPTEEEQPILMVPVAPPAPPTVSVAEVESQAMDPLTDSVLSSDSVGHSKVALPVSTLVRLMMDRTELATRLEMNEQIAIERNAAMEQILALSEKNSRLATQLAIAEVRQQYADNLVASLADRAEAAIRVTASASPSTLSNNEQVTLSPSIKAIQEDLANIRRQMSLLKRSQPVPFAASTVGLPVRPYVPTAQVVTPPSVESSTEPDQSDTPESSIK